MSRLAADLVCRSLLCFGIAAAVGGFLHDSTPAAPTCAQEAYGVFGAYDDGGDLVPGDLVPLRPGVEFGWRVQVTPGMHTWREVLVTPAAPREWVGADLTITDDGRVGVTERTESSEGMLEHAWTITDGDPAGAHEIRVYVDDALVKTFHFVVR